MNLEHRVKKIENDFLPDPQEEAKQEKLKEQIEEARQRVATMYKGNLPLCWNKPFDPKDKPRKLGKKPDIAATLAEARQNHKKRCMSCSQKEKCEAPYYRISKTK